MRESIGSTVLYNIIIVFLSIIFALILGTMVYYRTFKVNKQIIKIIEKYEGFNHLAKEEIELQLNSIGYLKKDLGACPKKDGKIALTNNSVFPYCVYYFEKSGSKYYSYGVITYVVFDMPFIDGSVFKFPIYAKTDEIFNFAG